MMFEEDNEEVNLRETVTALNSEDEKEESESEDGDLIGAILKEEKDKLLYNFVDDIVVNANAQQDQGLLHLHVASFIQQEGLFYRGGIARFFHERVESRLAEIYQQGLSKKREKK